MSCNIEKENDEIELPSRRNRRPIAEPIAEFFFGCRSAKFLLLVLSFVKNHGFLQTSPEYNMKILLSKLIFDVYQISHVFRDKENSNILEKYKTDETCIDEEVNISI